MPRRRSSKRRFSRRKSTRRSSKRRNSNGRTKIVRSADRAVMKTTMNRQIVPRSLLMKVFAELGIVIPAVAPTGVSQFQYYDIKANSVLFPFDATQDTTTAGGSITRAGIALQTNSLNGLAGNTFVPSGVVPLMRANNRGLYTLYAVHASKCSVELVPQSASDQQTVSITMVNPATQNLEAVGGIVQQPFSRSKILKYFPIGNSNKISSYYKLCDFYGMSPSQYQDAIKLADQGNTEDNGGYCGSSVSDPVVATYWRISTQNIFDANNTQPMSMYVKMSWWVEFFHPDTFFNNALP